MGKTVLITGAASGFGRGVAFGSGGYRHGAAEDTEQAAGQHSNSGALQATISGIFQLNPAACVLAQNCDGVEGDAILVMQRFQRALDIISLRIAVDENGYELRYLT